MIFVKITLPSGSICKGVKDSSVNIFICGWNKLENTYKPISFYNLAQLCIEDCTEIMVVSRSGISNRYESEFLVANYRNRLWLS